MNTRAIDPSPSLRGPGPAHAASSNEPSPSFVARHLPLRLFPTTCLLLTTVLASSASIGCAEKQERAKAPVVRETAADEVLRIGANWTSTKPEQGLLSPPSPVSLFRTQRTSRLAFTRDAATEQLIIDEEIELRSGGRVKCHTVLENQLAMRWGRKNGEAAVELVRPALETARSCDGLHPEPTLSEPKSRTLVVLRSDQLVVIEPSTEQRSYLPDAY